MLKAMKNEANKTYTENGAVTNVSTFSDCLDLFATVGALRKAPEKDILDRFIRAYTENPDTAMKILFFARDVRGGLGERRVFRTVMNYLAKNETESVKKNIKYFGEYGRFDDLLSLVGTTCEKDMLEYIAEQFSSDMKALDAGESVSLLAKWLPSVNASNGEAVAMAKKIARSMKMSDRDYRKAVVALRAKIRIIENNLREKDYSFDYSKQPSKAMFKYRAAFMRNDGERYGEFINKVNKGEAKLNASTVMPYELIDPYLKNGWGSNKPSIDNMTEEEKRTLNATWASMPDFGNDENAIAVVDTSGSMYWSTNPKPASVALSLGLYFAERNKGIFHNHFIEFSRTAQLIEIKGDTFADRLRWTVMKPIVEKYADEYLDGIACYKEGSSPQDNFSAFLQDLISKNDKLHDKYHEIFDTDVMEDEYAEDTEGFKSAVLKNDVEVIRRTLQSKSEALKEWKQKFFASKSQSLYDTFCNMIYFAEEYDQNMDENAMKSLDKVEDCGLSEMEEDACYKAGVLGYGIVSNILNHMYPRTFPGTYKSGIWSLYFLSDGTKKIEMPSGTSEFSMVKDETWSKTGIYEMEHNYFFPYEVFCIYTLRIYRGLVDKIAERFGKEYPSDYRFLLTNSFYEYVTSENKANIATLAGNDDVLKFNTPW